LRTKLKSNSIKIKSHSWQSVALLLTEKKTKENTGHNNKANDKTNTVDVANNNITG